MSTERNKAIASQVTEAHNQGNMAQLREVLSPDFVWHIADLPHSLNREQYIQGVEMGRQAFSNLTLSIEELIAEGEKVVLRVIVRGRHTGPLQGIAPTGKQVEYTSIAIRRIVDGKIAEEWQTNDQLSLLQQLGVFPPHP